MITPALRKEVICFYCRNVSAQEAAFVLNQIHKTTELTKAKVELIWSAEIEKNIVMRELGERPDKGFSPSPQTELAERMLRAMPAEAA